jgi:hypothetical protein
METKAATPKKLSWVPFPVKLFPCPEIKQDRRRAPGPELFVSERKLQERRSIHRKIVLGSSTE